MMHLRAFLEILDLADRIIETELEGNDPDRTIVERARSIRQSALFSLKKSGVPFIRNESGQEGLSTDGTFYGLEEDAPAAGVQAAPDSPQAKALAEEEPAASLYQEDEEAVTAPEEDPVTAPAVMEGAAREESEDTDEGLEAAAVSPPSYSYDIQEVTIEEPEDEEEEEEGRAPSEEGVPGTGENIEETYPYSVREDALERFSSRLLLLKGGETIKRSIFIAYPLERTADPHMLFCVIDPKEPDGVKAGVTINESKRGVIKMGGHSGLVIGSVRGKDFDVRFMPTRSEEKAGYDFKATQIRKEKGKEGLIRIVDEGVRLFVAPIKKRTGDGPTDFIYVLFDKDGASRCGAGTAKEGARFFSQGVTYGLYAIWHGDFFRVQITEVKRESRPDLCVRADESVF